MKHLILAGPVVLAIASGCTKETAKVHQPESAKALEVKAYAKMTSLTKAERYDFFEQKRMELSNFQKTYAQQEFELEDAFLALEVP